MKWNWEQDDGRIFGTMVQGWAQKGALIKIGEFKGTRCYLKVSK